MEKIYCNRPYFSVKLKKKIKHWLNYNIIELFWYLRNFKCKFITQLLISFKGDVSLKIIFEMSKVMTVLNLLFKKLFNPLVQNLKAVFKEPYFGILLYMKLIIFNFINGKFINAYFFPLWAEYCSYKIYILINRQIVSN